MTLSENQAAALKEILRWFAKPRRQYITLGGYAGTGKTTLIAYLREELNKRYPQLKVSFCSYTGKAARVLKNKLNETKTLHKRDSLSTIHGLIYSPSLNSNQEIVGWDRKDEIDAGLIIVDEASMVDKEIWRDLLSYEVPILAVGDHGQLPPIRGNFNLMEKPDLKLEQIYRQSSDNPIIELSIMARTKGEIPVGKYSDAVCKFDRTEAETQEIVSELLNSYNENTLVLCGYNFTRIKLNNYIRNSLGLESEEPIAGDRVICLRNNHKQKIYNGMLGSIDKIARLNENFYNAEITLDDGGTFFGPVYAKQFNAKAALNYSELRKEIGEADLFDFGYALTVHKAQGSQAKRVILFEERFKEMDEQTWKRWLYTAVTRAEQELFVIG
jgi:exodeoxyribonuclease-5